MGVPVGSVPTVVRALNGAGRVRAWRGISRASSMKVIVVGAGEVGFHIAERLSKEGLSVTVVESDAQKAQLLRGKLNAFVVHGSGADTEVLKRAGVEGADLFIAVTDRDEVNLVTGLLARVSGSSRVISRIKSVEYATKEWAKNARSLGIDLLINPQSVVADEIYGIISYTSAAEAAELADGRVVFLGYHIERGNPLAGIALRDLAGVRGIYRMVVTAIARRHETIIPRGEDTIQEGDIVYFVCNKLDVPAINYLFEFEREPARTVFILGGLSVGRALARRLVAAGLRVKVIEPDAAACQAFAEEFDKVMVLNTVGQDVETLRHEGVSDCDVYVAVTPNEQTNILCSLLAKSYGAKRAIALVDGHEFAVLAPSLGVDACISPRQATASAVVKFVRPSGVASLVTIEHSNAEVLDMVMPARSAILGRPLKELDLPGGSIIGVIVRGDEVVIPSGDDHLEAGDHVIVFALPEAVARAGRYFS